MIECNYTNEDLIMVQWIIIWTLTSALIVLWALSDNAKDDLPPVVATVHPHEAEAEY
jgi:hypothetical protein